MTVTVEFPLKTPNMTNRREHYMARARRQKKQRDVTTWFLKAARVPRQLKAAPVISLTRVSPGTLDAHDNLRSALKSVVDAIAAYFGVDDADPRISWRHQQAKGPCAVRLEFDLEAR